jgi:hypothetical protein
MVLLPPRLEALRQARMQLPPAQLVGSWLIGSFKQASWDKQPASLAQRLSSLLHSPLQSCVNATLL